MKVHDFDRAGSDLALIPLAARRCFDLAGVKPSLPAWQSLELGARRHLAELGARPVVDVGEVRLLLQDAAPAPEEVPERSDPPADRLPEVVARRFAGMGRLTDAIWVSLSDLDRYALHKLAERDPATEDDRARLRAAYDEIVGASEVSTHLRAEGGVRMVNVGPKQVTRRRAQAESWVRMNAEAFQLLMTRSAPKGDVLCTARLAGIMAAKRTPDWIPLCHALALTHVGVDLSLDEAQRAVRVVATVETVGKTGVEMEALTAASCAGLTVYDMLKGVDRGMVLGPTQLVSKSGGASGDYVRGEERRQP